MSMGIYPSMEDSLESKIPILTTMLLLQKIKNLFYSINDPMVQEAVKTNRLRFTAFRTTEELVSYLKGITKGEEDKNFISLNIDEWTLLKIEPYN